MKLRELVCNYSELNHITMLNSFRLRTVLNIHFLYKEVKGQLVQKLDIGIVCQYKGLYNIKISTDLIYSCTYMLQKCKSKF